MTCLQLKAEVASLKGSAKREKEKELDAHYIFVREQRNAYFQRKVYVRAHFEEILSVAIDGTAWFSARGGRHGSTQNQLAPF